MTTPLFKTTRTSTIKDPGQYWTDIVELDYQDFIKSPGSLRRAMHCAVTMFHMTDWLWEFHKPDICAIYGTDITAKDSRKFADKLQATNDDYGRLRRAAHAFKHAELSGRNPGIIDAPSSAQNLHSQSIMTEMVGGYSTAPFSSAPFGGGELRFEQKLVLEGPAGIEFKDVVANVRQLWIGLRAAHYW